MLVARGTIAIMATGCRPQQCNAVTTHTLARLPGHLHVLLYMHGEESVANSAGVSICETTQLYLSCWVSIIF